MEERGQGGEHAALPEVPDAKKLNHLCTISVLQLWRVMQPPGSSRAVLAYGTALGAPAKLLSWITRTAGVVIKTSDLLKMVSTALIH